MQSFHIKIVIVAVIWHFSLKKSEKSTFVDKWKSVELGFVFRYWNKTKLIPQRTTSNKSLFLVSIVSSASMGSWNKVLWKTMKCKSNFQISKNISKLSLTQIWNVNFWLQKSLFNLQFLVLFTAIIIIYLRFKINGSFLGGSSC